MSAVMTAERGTVLSGGGPIRHTPSRQAPEPRETAAQFRERCRGRWPSILQALGVPERFLNGKNQPCPICGGEDRARFTDHDQLGRVVCNQCMPPDECVDGFEFLQRLRSQSFAEVCGEIRGVLGETTVTPIRQPDTGKRRADIERVWRESLPLKALDPVHVYLAVTRGLAGTKFADLQAIRYHPTLGYWDGQTRTEHPAMVAMVTTAQGRCATLHRTYLSHDGQKADVETVRKHMKPVANWKGGGVRLTRHTAGQAIVTGEGIESCLALALRHPEAAIWPALDASHLAAFDPPQDAHVVIAADNDDSATGQLAAYRLAERLAKRGQSWEVCTAPGRGNDWADAVRRDVTGRAA